MPNTVPRGFLQVLRSPMLPVVVLSGLAGFGYCYGIEAQPFLPTTGQLFHFGDLLAPSSLWAFWAQMLLVLGALGLAGWALVRAGVPQWVGAIFIGMLGMGPWFAPAVLHSNGGGIPIALFLAGLALAHVASHGAKQPQIWLAMLPLIPLAFATGADPLLFVPLAAFLATLLPAAWRGKDRARLLVACLGLAILPGVVGICLPTEPAVAVNANLNRLFATGPGGTIVARDFVNTPAVTAHYYDSVVNNFLPAFVSAGASGDTSVAATLTQAQQWYANPSEYGNPNTLNATLLDFQDSLRVRGLLHYYAALPLCIMAESALHLPRQISPRLGGDSRAAKLGRLFFLLSLAGIWLTVLGTVVLGAARPAWRGPAFGLAITALAGLVVQGYLLRYAHPGLSIASLGLGVLATGLSLAQAGRRLRALLEAKLPNFRSIKEIGKSAAVYTLVGFLPLSFALVFTPVYTAFMGPDEYGLLNVFNLFIGIMVPLLSLGVTPAFGTLYWEYRRDKVAIEPLLSRALTTMLVVHIPTMLLISVLGYFLLPYLIENAERFTYWPFFLCAVGYSVFQAYFNFFLYFFRNENRLKRYVLLSLGSFFLMTAGTIATVVVLDLGANGAVVARTLAIILVAGSFLAVTVFRVRLQLHKATSWELIRVGLPVAGMLFVGGLAYSTDRALVERVFSLYNLGLYGFAVTIASVVEIFGNVVNNTLGPKIYKLMVADREANRLQIGRYAKIIFLSGVGAGVVILAIAQPLVMALIPPAYHETVYFLPALLLSHFLRSANSINTVLLYFTRRTGLMLATHLLSFAVNVGVGYWLCIELGMPGVLIGLVVSRAMQYGLTVWVAKSIFRFDFALKWFLQVLGIATVYVIGFYYFAQWVPTWLLALVPVVGLLVVLLFGWRRILKALRPMPKPKKPGVDVADDKEAKPENTMESQA